MRLIATFLNLIFIFTLSGCLCKKTISPDPFERSNREMLKFNLAFDATMIKPPTRLYRAIIPVPIRTGIGNMFDNVGMIPTIANDLLQLNVHYLVRDSWRFLINSTFGIAGFFDVADSNFRLPPHHNDFGLTLATWGYQQSSYLVLPFIGPTTVRDGSGLLIDCGLSPYGYLITGIPLIAVSSLRYLDIRSQLFEKEAYLNESLDQYTFIRDAYLQRRCFLITGEKENSESLYIDSEEEDKR